MNYESSICSNCHAYGGFGRCLDKYAKCKDCYSNCFAYQNKWNAKHNPKPKDNNGQKRR